MVWKQLREEDLHRPGPHSGNDYPPSCPRDCVCSRAIIITHSDHAHVDRVRAHEHYKAGGRSDTSALGTLS